MSTLRKLPAGRDHRVWNYQPTTLASTVQSKLCDPPPALSAVHTGRTSVSKLRKTFETSSQLGEEREKSGLTRTFAHIPIISSVRKPVSAVSTKATDVWSPSLDALDEHTVEAPPDKACIISPVSSAFYRLKSPVWRSNFGGSSYPSPAQPPRRSKRSQGRQSRQATRPGKKDDSLGDDVSPTSSANPETPRLAIYEPAAASQVVPSLQTLGLDIPATQDTSQHIDQIVRQKSAATSSERMSKVAELRNIFDRTKHPAVPGDGPPHQRADEADFRTVFEDSKQPQGAPTLKARASALTKGTTSGRQTVNGNNGVPLTCAVFPSPFRRKATSVTASPVQERISIFEGLVRPDLDSLQTGRYNIKKPKQDGSQSQSFLTGTNVFDGKKRSVCWLPKPFWKMPLHSGKTKGQTNDLACSARQVKESGKGTQEQPAVTRNYVLQKSSKFGEPRSTPQIEH